MLIKLTVNSLRNMKKQIIEQVKMMNSILIWKNTTNKWQKTSMTMAKFKFTAIARLVNYSRTTEGLEVISGSR